MSKHAGAYRSEKRKKELKRQKKQEEKRLKRQGRQTDAGEIQDEDGDNTILMHEQITTDESKNE